MQKSVLVYKAQFPLIDIPKYKSKFDASANDYKVLKKGKLLLSKYTNPWPSPYKQGLFYWLMF